MMKRFICFIIALSMTFAAAGCGQKPEEKVQEAPLDSAQVEYDVDLTKLSSTMVYSEVYNMIAQPQDYLGKTVRMNGQFAIYQVTEPDGTPVPDKIYYACLIADATACCQQGIEFILKGDYRYPDDYPPLGTVITVTGEFQTYIDEDGYEYCHLIDANMEL